jgi:1-deoxy-D-xylulose-5-phosphate reductoisomerase
MTAKQRLCILGSTGSIGVNTLNVVALHPDRFEVYALTGHQRVDLLTEQCLRWRPRFAAMPDPAMAHELKLRLQRHGSTTEVVDGPGALGSLAAHPDVDAVMAAIVGAAGLTACMAAAKSGKRLLLANKEALVVGGAHFMAAVQQGGALLLPIDSEHSAIFQCLPLDRQAWPTHIDHIVLTASGGPFRERDVASLEGVTPDQACAHPNWVMGRKISVDSATMMNKALEVIEARWLFDLQPEQIKVVVHPQSILHSMVVCADTSVLAQLGTPDMRVAISYGLSFPDRMTSGAQALDFLTLGALTFEPPRRERFPGFFLAWEALQGPEGTCAVLNAANEVAVAAFLDQRISFNAIHRLNAAMLEQVQPSLPLQAEVDDLLALDHQVRAKAGEALRRFSI